MVECESRIERVTVYARGAVITRHVTLPPDLPGDAVELVIGGVTPLARASSLSAVAVGGREVISLRTRLVVPDAPAAPGPLLERVRALGLERQRLGAERTHLTTRRDVLGGLAIQPRWVRRARPVDPAVLAADALSMSELVNAKIERLDARIRDLDDALEANTRETEAAKLAAAEGRSSQRQGASHPVLQILLRLSAASSDVPLQSLEVEYAIGAARWWPAYKAWLSAGATKARWEVDAFVAQATGEDWAGIQLSLTTADLAHDARLPELRSIRMGRAQPPARKGYRPPPAGLDQLFQGHDEAMARWRDSIPSPPRQQQVRAASRPAPAMAPPPAMDRSPAYPPPPPAPGASAAAIGRMIDSELKEEAELGQMDAPAAALVAARPAPARQSTAPAAFAGPVPAAPAARAYMAAGAAPPMSASLASVATEDDDATPARPAAPPSPPAIEPAEAWLDFDSLTLPSPQDRDKRGRLVREPQSAQVNAAASARISIDSLAGPALSCDPRESRGQFDHRMDAGGTCDVPSNARPHRVAITGKDATASPRFRTVPRESPEVYREAHIPNPLHAPLLAGPVDVFMDGALMTTAAIPAVDRGGTIRLGLGVEDRIRVARNARVEEGSAGLLGGSTVVDHHVAIDLASSLGIPVGADVIDRLPVTDDKDISVKLVSSSPAAEPYDQAELGMPVRGALRFRAELPAGGKARIEFTYRIKLPAKSEIVGGNRRE
jgi:hypothetical protein